MDLSADLSRRIESLIRSGTVAEVDTGSPTRLPRCRVRTGGLLTDWLHWTSRRTGSTRVWDPITIGEQVLVLSPSGDPAQGFVIAGLYSNDIRPPSTSATEWMREFPDGAVIRYDHATGTLSASGIKELVVEAQTTVSINAPQIQLTGEVHVLGPILQSGGPMKSNGIVLDSHRHDGVAVGAGVSGLPQ